MKMKIICTGENVLVKTDWRDGIKQQPLGVWILYPLNTVWSIE